MAQPSIKPGVAACRLQLSPSPPDTLLLSDDLCEFLLQGDTSGYIASKAVERSDAAWTLFEAKGDSTLSPNTCQLAPSYYTLALGTTVLLQRVTPIVLDEVILSCPHQTYGELQNNHDQILQAVGIDSGKLVRQNFLDPATNLRVRKCEPVAQGIVKRGVTNITVVKDGQEATDKESQAQFNEQEEEVEISRFLDFDNQGTSNIELEPKPLSSPIPLGSILPRPRPYDDVEAFAYVRIETLAKLGCLSGDIAIVTHAHGNRRIKLLSYPDPSSASASAGAIYMSPFLIFNMGSPTSVSLSKPKGLDSVDSFSGSGLETAQEVTISRLANDVTTDKTLQPLFLAGLRLYFECCRRVIHENDVIAVPVDTVLAQLVYQAGAHPNDEFDVSSLLPGSTPNCIAWFKITSIKCQTAGAQQCLVDPSVTRMVQSGLLTGPIPQAFLRWRNYVALPEFVSYPATGDIFPYASRLHQLVRASLDSTLTTVVMRMSILLHSTKRGTGKTELIRSVAGALGIHMCEIDCFNILSDSEVKTMGSLKAKLEIARQISPCIVLLNNLDAISHKSGQDGSDDGSAMLRSVLSEYISGTAANSESEIGDRKNHLGIVATVTDIDKLTDSARSLFTFELEIGVPSERERQAVFSHLLSQRHLTVTQLDAYAFKDAHAGFEPEHSIQLAELAQRSAGLTPSDIVAIVETAKVHAMERLKGVMRTKASDNPALTISDLILAYGGKVKLTGDDLDAAIDDARSKYSDSIGAPKIPNVTWKDVGGLDNVKKEILDTIEMPLKHPELFSAGVRKRSGILFYGPPGTGKTLLAKAIATSFSLNFFSVKGPELLNMYIGESEANVRKVFQKARDARPCVVFFDELDSVAPKRGNQGDSGGVMDRIVSQLLAELDGMSSTSGEGVFVVGATNRPDLLDSALLRPGRFDKMLYLGVSDTHKKQETILEALTRKFELADDVSLQKIAETCPFTYTGADFYALSSDAMLNAMLRTAANVDEKIKQYNLTNRNPGEDPVSTRWWFQNIATDADTEVKVTMADFAKAQNELLPSVSADELRHYQSVRDNFEKSEHKDTDNLRAGNGHVNGQTNGHTENGLPNDAVAIAQKPRSKKGKGKAKAI